MSPLTGETCIQFSVLGFGPRPLWALRGWTSEMEPAPTTEISKNYSKYIHAYKFIHYKFKFKAI